jgi:hypothetical protein
MPNKLKRILLCFVLPLIASAPSWAQSPPMGATVQTWHLDPQTNMVTVQIVNNSHKEITAYNIAIKETYADGHVNKHELLCEYMGRIALIQEVQGTVDEADIRKQFGDGLLHPGEIRDELIAVQAGLRDFQSVVDVVAYADQTAEATNNDGLQRLLAGRKAGLASTQMSNDIIRGALADPNDTDPATTAATKIQAQITLWKAQQHTAVDPGVLQGVVAELKAMSAHRTNTRDALQQFVVRREAQVATLSPHAELKKIGGPQ